MYLIKYIKYHSIVEERLSDISTPSTQEIKSIFNSDDDEEDYYTSSKQTRPSMKRKKGQSNETSETNNTNETNNIPSKKGRFNASQLLAAFDKDINREFNLQQREIHKTE